MDYSLSVASTELPDLLKRFFNPALGNCRPEDSLQRPLSIVDKAIPGEATSPKPETLARRLSGV